MTDEEEKQAKAKRLAEIAQGVALALTKLDSNSKKWELLPDSDIGGYYRSIKYTGAHCATIHINWDMGKANRVSLSVSMSELDKKWAEWLENDDKRYEFIRDRREAEMPAPYRNSETLYPCQLTKDFDEKVWVNTKRFFPITHAAETKPETIAMRIFREFEIHMNDYLREFKEYTRKIARARAARYGAIAKVNVMLGSDARIGGVNKGYSSNTDRGMLEKTFSNTHARPGKPLATITAKVHPQTSTPNEDDNIEDAITNNTSVEMNLTGLTLAQTRDILHYLQSNAGKKEEEK